MAGVKPLLETIGALLPKGIKAWHASPHDFDKVDLGKIGTGQGAASYGPGFYAAESPAVSGQGGEYWMEFLRKFGDREQEAASILRQSDFDRPKALEDIRSRIDQFDTFLGTHKPGDPGFDDYLKLKRDYEGIAKKFESGEQIGPRVYELNLKADPRSFLQWDEPLSQQSNITKAVPQLLDAAKDEAYGRALSSTNKPRADQLWNMVKNPSLATGEIAFRELGRDPQKGMTMMRDAGIPGVRYLDAKSRSLADYSGAQQKDLDEVIAQITKYRAEGNNLRASELDQHRARMERTMAQPRTYNYVINNPDIIEIMRKLAIPGMLTGGAASVYQPQGQQ